MYFLTPPCPPPNERLPSPPPLQCNDMTDPQNNGVGYGNRKKQIKKVNKQNENKNQTKPKKTDKQKPKIIPYMLIVPEKRRKTAGIYTVAGYICGRAGRRGSLTSSLFHLAVRKYARLIAVVVAALDLGKRHLRNLAGQISLTSSISRGSMAWD